jgi:hypothetical protein
MKCSSTASPTTIKETPAMKLGFAPGKMRASEFFE